MLEKVKKMLGITGSYQDNTIAGYIEEVKRFLIDGGVSKTIANDSSTVGLIARGVADLWNYGSGGTSFSPYFLQRAIQLAEKTESDLADDDSTDSDDTTTEEETTETEGDTDE